MIKTSVIFPARNEEELIKASVLDTYKYLKTKKYPFEILVVVNGSSDKTKEIVENLSKNNKQIKLLESEAGYGHALKKGLSEAKGDYMVIFNVDFYDLHLIDLIDIDLYGRDFIIGSKMAQWSEDKRSLPRRTVSMLFNFYLKIIHGFKGSDTHGIKVFRKQVLNKVFEDCKTSSGIFDTEFVIRAQYAGFSFADFPVSVDEKRPPRFSNRLLQTPMDIWHLYQALNEKK